MGKNDKLIYSSDAAKFKDILDNAKIEPIDDVWHSPHVENPTITLDKIKTFFR
jgi:hypothetical protein